MSENTGWVSIHRKLLDSPIYSDSQAVHLWIHLVLKACHVDSSFVHNAKIVTVKRGQILTGRKRLANETGLSDSKIERLLTLFESLKMIEQQTNSKNRYISITNYESYQKTEQQLNSKRTATEQQLNTYNNVNNVNNVNKETIMQSSDCVGGEKSTTEKQDRKIGNVNYQHVADVFSHWQQRMNHPWARLDDKRKKLILKSLKMGYSKDDLISAIDGCAKSAWHMGDNDRKKKFDDIGLILRDASYIDRFIKINLTSGVCNENNQRSERETAMGKTAAGRMQLNIERELTEIAAARSGNNTAHMAGDGEFIPAKMDNIISGGRG